MKVAQILKAKGSDIATVPATTSVAEVVRKLKERRVGALVVSPDGQSIDGIVSERDVVRGLAEQGGRVLESTAANLMTRSVVTCGPDDRVAELMALMTEHRIRHLPVVADGRLAGIISIGDVVKNRVDELENEAGALREYIAAS